MMIATISPTHPWSPNDDTISEILPITSPMNMFAPNNMLATMPNPSKPNSIDVKPPTTEFTVSIILFIKTFYEFNNELYIIHYTQQMSTLTIKLTTVFTESVESNSTCVQSNTTITVVLGY